MLDPTEKLICSAFGCRIILRFGTSQASYPMINVQLLNRRYLLSGDLPRVVEGVDPYKSPTMGFICSAFRLHISEIFATSNTRVQS